MTTATDWETPVVDFKSRKAAPAPTRGHLRLVPATSASIGSTPTHITRRGRLTVTIFLVLLCTAAAVVGIRGMAAAGASAPAFDTVTVQSGQTLSNVAQRAYPGLAVRDGIARIQLANSLNTDQLFGGEQLRIPR